MIPGFYAKNKKIIDVDIVICGAGPVGLSLAALLIKCDVAPDRIALIDNKSIDQTQQDSRSIALSYGSYQILKGIGGWPVSSTAIHQIHVSRRGHFGHTLIRREELKSPTLGYVVNYSALIKALESLPCLSGVHMVRPAHVITNTEHHRNIALQLSNGCKVHGQVLIQAEGKAHTAQNENSSERNYQQVGIVAYVQSSLPILHRAFERFTDQGPLALLPQDDNQGYNYALVWCVRFDTANQLLRLDDSTFLTALTKAFGGRLGSFVNVSSRNHFPLSLNTCHVITARTVTIGNAAQTLHPVAGQGLNLGLRDAKVLANLLANGFSSDILQKFSLIRKPDRYITILATDIMARIFSNSADGTLPQALLGLSLGLIDIVYPVKRLFAQQMIFGKR